VENEDLIRYVYPPCLSECLYAAVEFAPIGFRIHFHELVSFLSELSLFVYTSFTETWQTLNLNVYLQPIQRSRNRLLCISYLFRDQFFHNIIEADLLAL